MIKLNLASGQRPFQTWTNIDIRRQKASDGTEYQCDIEADVKKIDMFDDNSVDVMVAHHLVEHFRLDEIKNVAHEWCRVLKPGGKLAVFVPDMRAVAQGWLDGRIDNFIFFVNCYGAYQGFDTDIHKWGYDLRELSERFSEELTWSQIKLLDQSSYLNDPVYHGSDCAFDWWILSVEFTK